MLKNKENCSDEDEKSAYKTLFPHKKASVPYLINQTQLAGHHGAPIGAYAVHCRLHTEACANRALEG